MLSSKDIIEKFKKNLDTKKSYSMLTDEQKNRIIKTYEKKHYDDYYLKKRFVLSGEKRAVEETRKYDEYFDFSNTKLNCGIRRQLGGYSVECEVFTKERIKDHLIDGIQQRINDAGIRWRDDGCVYDAYIEDMNYNYYYIELYSSDEKSECNVENFLGNSRIWGSVNLETVNQFSEDVMKVKPIDYLW